MFFEDFAEGDRFTTGSRTISTDDITGFARQWDRQPFHLDAEAAKDSIYGGLIASGFQTLLVSFGLIIDAAIWTEASQGSPGIDELRWLKPVRPGDSLSVEAEVVATRESRRPDRGYVTFDHTTRNQHGEAVATYRSTHILLRRTPADAAG